MCMDVCMCTHNFMHMFGVSAHFAVDMCVLDMCNTFTKHIGSRQVVRVGAAAPRFFNSKYLFFCLVLVSL